MDATDYPSLGRIAQLNAQLAAQASRVDAVVSVQLDSVERLFCAASSADWESIARASRELANPAMTGGDTTIIRFAGVVCEALRRDPTGVSAKGPLAILLDACRSAKRRSWS